MTDNQGIQERTLTFAVRIVKLCPFLHKMEISLKEARETEYWLIVKL
jgi:hypothetical protein